MRIAIFTNNYLPNPYGVTGSIESFRNELEKHGHTVFIFAPKFPGYVDTNKNVFRYPAIDVNIRFRFPLAVPYSWKMNRILRDLEIDIIHAQHPNLLGAAAARWARRKNIPLVFTWHTLYDKYTNFVPFIPPKLSAGYIIGKAVRYADRADAVIVPTDSIIPILREWGVKNKKIFPVATGVLEKEFEKPDRKTIREKYGIADDKTLLLLISRLTGEKNVEFVLRSVARILRKENKLKFLVSGGGYLVPEIKKYVAENGLQNKIILTDVVERQELKNYYAAADIFVYGSKSETQGMVVSEAMYCGLPIVAVNATGTSSLVLNNGNGFLVSENEEEFAAAVIKLIEDKDLRQKFGETSARIARIKFTSDVCAEEVLKVYGQVMAEDLS